MKTKILLFALTSLIISCSSPMDKKYDEETSQADIQAIKSEIDSTEMKILASSMMRLMMKDKNLEELTYAQILEKGKEYKKEQEAKEAEQKAIAEEAAKKEKERIKKLTEAVVVSCFEKGFVERDFEKYITYKFIIKNKSDKAIRAVKGNISFTNVFDDEIKSFYFVYYQQIQKN